MRLTVIVPLYNRETLIQHALLSLLRQRDACDLDILVVNDGSTDSGPDRVKALAQRAGNIRMISTENQGVAKARNVGLRNIADDAEVVSFLDSDDVSPANRIRNDLPVFLEDPSVQFTYGKITLVDSMDDGAFAPNGDSRQVTVRGISMSAGVYRTSFLQELGQFDESFEQAEDTDFLFRAFESKSNYRLTDTICVYYRRHSENMTCDKELALKSFMRAVHRSLVRRKRNPSLGMPTDVFDMKALMQTPMD